MKKKPSAFNREHPALSGSGSPLNPDPIRIHTMEKTNHRGFIANYGY
jgi:hypothetical protein